METSLAEIILALAALYGIYRLLSPLQRRLERWILGVLDPRQALIVDAEISDADSKKKNRKE